MANDETARLSRRDFLRRAGKDAAQTGVRLVPGANVAKAVLGLGEQPEADNAAGEEGAPGKPASVNAPRWLQRVLSWRAERGSHAPPSEEKP